VDMLADRLGLYEDEPESEVTAPDVKFDNYNDPEPEPKPGSTSLVPSKKKLSPLEAAAEMDAIFATDYLQGKATDSAGNKFDGTNDRWPLQEDRADEAVAVTLIGPMGRQKPVAPSGTDHMVPELLSNFRPASFDL